MALFALMAHALAVVCRRRGLQGRATGVVAVGALVLAIGWILLPETTAYGIPTAATLAEAGRQLSSAWTMFHDV